MIFFAAGGWGIKLVIDGNLIAKKLKIWKFWTKHMLFTSKKKQRTHRIQIQVEKVWFFGKKSFLKIFLTFLIFFGVGIENMYFSIFQNFQKIFWKMTSIGPKKCSKKQSHEIWAHLKRQPRRHARSSTRACWLYPIRFP